MAQEIFKICHLKDNNIYKIDVFNGNETYVDENIREKYASNPDIFNEVFDSEEIENILENNIDVFYHKQLIFIDDTIETIKKKIINVNNIAFEEIYLFYSYQDRLSSYQIYSNLTQNGKIPLIKNTLLQFILNINREDIFETLPDKEVYEYTDILELGLDKEDLLINNPLGQIMSYETDIYPLTVNPFVVLAFTEDNVYDLIKTNNKSLLLSNNVNEINNNTIYCCNANDVLEYITKESLSQPVTIKLYYPYLSKEEILSYATLKEKTSMLLTKSKEMIDDNFERTYENISSTKYITKEAKS